MNSLLKTFALCTTLAAAFAVPLHASVQGATEGSLNKAEQLERFRDMGFGLFIHWSHDSQLGSVISHSMVAADDDYLKRYIQDLPRTFNPRKFNPQDWAVLARLAGIRYVVFTAKHHNGFCMWPTQTTDFSIANTPFKRDITGEILAAFREQGIAPGLYFSPDDFLWLHQNGRVIQRHIPEVQPSQNPGLMALNQAQMRELLTNYGPIDVIFFDGEAQGGLREQAWELQPDTVVTRGAIHTPEQYIPGVPLDEAWEACLTMGTQWQYKPTNDNYKSGGELISLLIETRAKGGNLLLNVGPKPDGELPIEQEERLREVALWMFINQECIYNVRPWIITNEGDVWFTKQKDSDTLYAIVKTKDRWPYAEWRDFVLKSIRTTPETTVSVLGQNDEVIEYQTVVPKTTWSQEADGLHIRANRAVRIYNNRQWPNPVVLKITHAQPALVPPSIDTVSVQWDNDARAARFGGTLKHKGDADALEVGFEFRDITGQDITERGGAWTTTPLTNRSETGEFRITSTALQPGRTYEIRAVAKHPLLTLYGRDLRLRVP